MVDGEEERPVSRIEKVPSANAGHEFKFDG
jgi:hypothetical protein